MALDGDRAVPAKYAFFNPLKGKDSLGCRKFTGRFGGHRGDGINRFRNNPVMRKRRFERNIGRLIKLVGNRVERQMAVFEHVIIVAQLYKKSAFEVAGDKNRARIKRNAEDIAKFPWGKNKQ